MKKMETEKTTGPYNVEMTHTFAKFELKVLVPLINAIYETGHMPEEL